MAFTIVYSVVRRVPRVGMRHAIVHRDCRFCFLKSQVCGKGESSSSK